ncbi:Right origin-binding protein [Phocoenobacter uteri]|uniref:Right origin-binding protein n=1 Tax=Phocoenobacter uteri TaxID=146806 RepID=A0A379CDT0_9PAST|nr:AraC family transcriptional regulator [Phocoenobacter uteri]MDG6881828.1 hypothetical protein [Phocoenobacter uteri]SUB59865.1 Right origin-binding protein [Phocoenobacter uteri]
MSDSLDKLIQFAQISGGIDTQCQLQGDWFLKHNHQPEKAVVHIVVEGEGYLKIAGEKQSHLLKTGDVIFFSRAAPHILSSQCSCENSMDIPLVDSRGCIQIKHKGVGKSDFTLFCAHFSYDKYATLFYDLPEWLSVHLPDSLLQPLLALLKQEISGENIGSQQVIDSLSVVLLIAIIRRYLDDNPADTGGLLRGIQDHRLTALLNGILRSPEEDWSIEKMMIKSHLSRAQLMRVFKQQVGVTPHVFLQKIRLQQAAVLLKRTAHSICNIALLTGFQSETHFIKSFKKMYEMTPSVYRKR